VPPQRDAQLDRQPLATRAERGGLQQVAITHALRDADPDLESLRRVLIRKGDTADTGDIVVALIDEEEATLKRLRRRGDSIALEAANPSYETRIFGPDRVRVQGRLVGLIRRY